MCENVKTTYNKMRSSL